MSGGRSAPRQPQPLTRTASLALAACAALAASVPVRQARAQAVPSISLTSEYSARGVSLSRGRPALQARIDVDDASGWYGGAFASRVSLPDSEAKVQLIGYGGYAHRLPSGLAWEAGALDVSFPGGQQYRYHEFYAGLSRDRVTARLYFSPSYYGGSKTIYTEMNAAWPLGGRYTLAGHAGLLHLFGGSDDDAGESRNRLDLRGAVNVDLGACSVQLALVAGAPGRHRREAARSLAVSATWAF